MIFDSITVAEGSNIKNMVVDSGGSFPSAADIGEFYYRTSDNTLYIYTPSGWDSLMSAAGSGTLTIGTTDISVGGTVTSLTGLASVSAGTFNGALSGTASYATVATNILGGGIGYIPVQAGSNMTGYITPGTSGYVLTSNGSGNAPSWQQGGGVAENLTGTALGSNIVGSSLSSVGTITTGVWQGSTVSSNYGGTGQSTYGVGDILYASGTTTLSKLAIGNTGDTLIVEGGVPTWAAAGANNNAGNIVGGLAGSIPYQSAINTTTFVGIGSTGQVLTVNNGVPSWENVPSGITSVIGTTNQVTVLTVNGTSTISLPSNITITGTLTAGTISGTVSTSTNIAGGAVGYIPYQLSAGSTSFIAPGTSGYVLTSNGGGNAPSWQAATGGSGGSITIGTTSISGGGSSSTLAGLTSVTSTVFVGTLTTGSQTNITAVGTLGTLAVTNAITQNGGQLVGYLGIPQNAQGNYTCVLSDAGKHIFTATGGVSWTIPSNAAVAYPIGTTIAFINQSSTACTISVTTDTMYVVSSGITGNRTLSGYGMATVVKTTATTWMISGNNLS